MNQLIFPAINHAILVGFIVYKAKPGFYAFIKKRHEEVFEGLNRSKVQAQTVAQRKKEIEAKIKNLDAEKAQIAAEWKQREVDQSRSIKEGSLRVVTQMRQEFEQNKKALELTLLEESLRSFRRNVVAQAEMKIKQALNPALHGKINQEFIKEASVT